MRILVVGAGATGGYFGARLAQAGLDVAFLVRAQRAQQLKRDGLQIISPHGDLTLKPQLLQAHELSQPFDLIILSVKSFALNQAMDDIAPAVGEQTMIMPILNGMQHIATLRQRFGEARIVGGLCKIIATLNDQQQIVQMTPLHQLIYGEFSGEMTPRIEQLDRLLRQANIEAQLSDNVQRDLWEKWLFLASLGAVCCLMRGDTAQVMAAPQGEQLIGALFAEVLATLVASGYEDRPAVTARLLESLCQADKPMTSSMYRDLMQGNAIEAQQIIGDLVGRAQRHSVPTPLLSATWTQLNVWQQQRQA